MADRQQTGTAAQTAPGQHQRKRKRKPRPPRTPGRNERTLSCVVQALAGRKLVVELRNDAIIRGKLDDADEYMNLYMSDVICQDVMGHKQEYAFLYVKGRNVRFVHLPKSLDPAAAVEQQRQKLVQLRIQNFKERQRQVPSTSVPKGDAGAAFMHQEAAAHASGSRDAAHTYMLKPAAAAADTTATGEGVQAGQLIMQAVHEAQQQQLDVQQGSNAQGELWAEDAAYGEEQMWAEAWGDGDGDEAADSEDDDHDNASGEGQDVHAAEQQQGTPAGDAGQSHAEHKDDDEGFDFD